MGDTEEVQKVNDKLSSTSLLAAALDCIRSGKKPLIFRSIAGERPLWCIDWGGDNVQIIVKLEYAIPMIKRLCEYSNHGLEKV